MKVNYMNIIYDEYNKLINIHTQLEQVETRISEALKFIKDHPNTIENFKNSSDIEKEKTIDKLKDAANEFQTSISDAIYYVDEAMTKLTNNDIV